MHQATTFQLIGAAAFGALIGWYLYFINRHRKSGVRLTDLITVIGAVGGGAILKLFPAGTDLFAGYGIGLFAGFFIYFIILLVMVIISDNFTVDYFIDGRHRRPRDDEQVAAAAMGDDPAGTGVAGENGDDRETGEAAEEDKAQQVQAIR